MTKTLRFMEHMCNQQKDEFAALLYAADEIGAAATSVATNGGQGYNQLLEARDCFKKMLSKQFEHYRIFYEEEQ